MKNSWTLAEVRIVRAKYPQHGAKYCASLLAGRSWKSVEHVAIRNGIQRIYETKTERGIKQARKSCAQSASIPEQGSKWDQKEIKILRANYCKLGASACTHLLPGRTIHSIHSAARRRRFHTATIPGNARDPWLYSVAKETHRRAHAAVGCRVRLVIPERGMHYLTTQHRGGLLLDAVPHTVGFYAASCTVAQIREDIVRHLAEVKVAA